MIKMNSETYLDFCFVRATLGEFSTNINQLLSELFRGMRLNWYLDEKVVEGADVVIAEIKGMTRFQSEEEVIHYIETHAKDDFWCYLQGYKMFVYPNGKGCGSGCAGH